MPKVTRTNTKGLIQEAGSGATGVVFSESVTISLPAGGLVWATSVTQPAGSVLVDAMVVCTTAVNGNGAAGTTGLRIGTAAAGGQIITLDADSIGGSANNLAAGKGTAIHAKVQAGLGGNAALTFNADQLYTATERLIYPEVVRSANAAIAGEFTVHLTFMSA